MKEIKVGKGLSPRWVRNVDFLSLSLSSRIFLTGGMYGLELRKFRPLWMYFVNLEVNYAVCFCSLGWEKPISSVSSINNEVNYGIAHSPNKKWPAKTIYRLDYGKASAFFLSISHRAFSSNSSNNTAPFMSTLGLLGVILLLTLTPSPRVLAHAHILLVLLPHPHHHSTFLILPLLHCFSYKHALCTLLSIRYPHPHAHTNFLTSFLFHSSSPWPRIYICFVAPSN